MVSAGIFHTTQPLAGGIDLAQSGPNRFTSLGSIKRSAVPNTQVSRTQTSGSQVIEHAEHPGIHTEHLRQHDICTVYKQF